MTTRRQIVDEARTWIGTPFQHQAHVKGVGVDCAGLVRGAMIATHIMPADVATWPHAARYLGYARRPDGKTLLEALDVYLVRIDLAALQIGDVLAMRFERDPQHLGIVGDYVHGGLSLIHALGQVDGKGRVVEHRLSPDRIANAVAAFALPGVA